MQQYLLTFLVIFTFFNLSLHHTAISSHQLNKVEYFQKLKFSENIKDYQDYKLIPNELATAIYPDYPQPTGNLTLDKKKLQEWQSNNPEKCKAIYRDKITLKKSDVESFSAERKAILEKYKARIIIKD